MKYNFYVNEICKNARYSCLNCVLNHSCFDNYETENEKIEKINEFAYQHYQKNVNLYRKGNKTKIK